MVFYQDVPKKHFVILYHVILFNSITFGFQLGYNIFSTYEYEGFAVSTKPFEFERGDV